MYEISSSAEYIEMETLSTSWDGDHSRTLTSTLPLLLRGGYCRSVRQAGIFNFIGTNMDKRSGIGFRVVLGIN